MSTSSQRLADQICCDGCAGRRRGPWLHLAAETRCDAAAGLGGQRERQRGWHRPLPRVCTVRRGDAELLRPRAVREAGRLQVQQPEMHTWRSCLRSGLAGLLWSPHACMVECKRECRQVHWARRLTFYTAPVSLSALLPVLIWQEVRMPLQGSAQLHVCLWVYLECTNTTLPNVLSSCVYRVCVHMPLPCLT